MSEIEEFLSKHVSRISTAPVHNTSFGLCPRMSPARRSYVNELSGTSEQVAQKPFQNIVTWSIRFQKENYRKHVSVESPPTFTEKEPYLWYRRSVRQNGVHACIFKRKSVLRGCHTGVSCNWHPPSNEECRHIVWSRSCPKVMNIAEDVHLFVTLFVSFCFPYYTAQHYSTQLSQKLTNLTRTHLAPNFTMCSFFI